MLFACVLHFAMSSSAFHPHVFQNLHLLWFPRFSPLSVPSPTTLARAHGTSQFLFCESLKNVLGMGRDLPSGLGISQVDLPSNLVPFGGCLMPQRLTTLTVGPLSLCSPTPLHNIPLAHQTPLHALRCWITIVWAKSTTHLDSPSSLYL